MREKRSLRRTDAKDALYRSREPWILQKIAEITEGKLLLLRVEKSRQPKANSNFM